MELSPMLASAAPTPPEGPGWVFEPKWDGFRVLARIDGRGGLRLWSRQGRRWDRAFPELAAVGPAVGRPAVLDGEVVVMGGGRPDFGLLSRRLFGQGLHRPPPATLVAFDVLALDGEPTTGLPWHRRRALLAGLGLDGRRAVATMVCDDGAALFDATGALGVEGLVAKRRGSAYLCGRRSRAWVKVKHRQEGWFDVVGWRPPGRRRPTGALLLAEDGTPAGTAIPALRAPARHALAWLVGRHGTAGDGGVVWLPAGAQARASYLGRTTRGTLREAVARDLRPALPA